MKTAVGDPRVQMQTMNHGHTSAEARSPAEAEPPSKGENFAISLFLKFGFRRNATTQMDFTKISL